MNLQIKLLREDAIIPTRNNPDDSGLDLYAVEDTDFWAGQTRIVPTGIAFGIPEGYEIQVRPRSGLSLKTQMIVKNAPGTVDRSYTGECCVIMCMLRGGSDAVYTVKRGDRIAQAVLCPVAIPTISIVDELNKTDRGSNGFGSSGV
jgi:dUTP pyrophosphatase